jgi:hypothetical protein
MEREQVTCFPGSTLYDLAFFYNVLFVWLISHQPTVLFSQNKSATSNQSSQQRNSIFLSAQISTSHLVRAAPLSVSMYMTLWE